MKHFLYILCLTFSCIPTVAQVLPAFGDERAGISLASSLKIGVGARATGMAETIVSVIDDASAVYWNPAGMTQKSQHQIAFSQTMWFGGLDHQSAQGIYRVDDESAIGIGFSTLSSGMIAVTTEFKPFGTGEFINFNSSAFSVAYARQFTEQFSAGITMRYLHENAGSLRMSGVLFDAGTFYKTGLGTSRFAVAVSNFGGKFSPNGTVNTGGNAPNFNGGTISAFQSFDPPINFRIGFAMEPILDSMQRWTVALQLNHPNDNAENYGMGTEYAVKFSEAFPAEVLIRAGYKIGADQERFSGGAGFHIPISGREYELQLDYAYSDYSSLGGIHRMTAGFAF